MFPMFTGIKGDPTKRAVRKGTTSNNLGTIMTSGRFFVGLIAISSLAGGYSLQALSYDANVTPNVIFGTGNGNGFWTVDLQNNIELGLRAKVRYQGIYNSGGDGTYSFDPGVSSGSAAKWNYEFAINVNQDGSTSDTISDYDIWLSIDIDPSQGQNFITFSPFQAWSDNSFGDNSTAQSGGIEASDFPGQLTLMGQYYVAQNSQNIGWLAVGSPPVPLVDVNADGTYDFKLFATRAGANDVLAQTSMRVIVGQGGAPVPDGGATFGLLAVPVLALLGLRRRVSS